MSNNPNWKRQLQDKINEHNRQHGSKPKGVSNKTMHERACSLGRLESRMPEELRATWALRKQGQDYKTIAKNLSIPLGTVKSRFHRLVEYLRKELGNET